MENNTAQEKKLLRCAIYTRVSTSDNLEKEFTSLDSQRESGESYIASQKSEGWTVLPDRYDDAGYTGANTERPALQSLISNIKEKKIDCIVVYKVDRLSRSLLDFSQLLEFFDQNNVTFVSVTQHFNTNTSMGRLTLNILLSFAQFEREIISERTRDKMGAAKRKGKWIGGCVPLGYDLDKVNHKLLVNLEEAKIVCELFDLYLKKCSLLEVAKIANSNGYKTKAHKLSEGRQRGGIKFLNTSIERIIKNAYYIGKVKYHDKLYPGEHKPIISDDIFQKAQQILSENRPNRVKKSVKNIGLLSGILHCKSCNSSMYNTYSFKNSKKKKYKYNYYLCLNAHKRGYNECPTRLLSGHLLEAMVMRYLRTLSKEPKINYETWETLILEEKILILKSIVKQVYYDGNKEILGIILQNNDKCYEIKVEKKELKRVNEPPRETKIKVEPQLRKNLLLAHQIQEVLNEGRAKNLKEISGWLNMSPQRINQIASLLLLSPKIQEEIILFKAGLLSSLPEYKLRQVINEIDWENQYKIWQELLKNTTKK